MTPNVMGSLRIIVFTYSITVFLLVKRLLSGFRNANQIGLLRLFIVPTDGTRLPID